MLVNTGPQTVYTGLGLYTVAPGAANMAASVAPITNLGPATQPTLGPGVGTTSVIGSGGVGSGVPSISSVGDPMAMQNSANPMSSHSPILWAIGGMFLAVAGLHFIFYPKEKVL